MGESIQKLIKQSKFESAAQKAFINLIFTYNYFYYKQCDFFKPYDLLPQHYNILKIVKGKAPEPTTPSYIIDVMLDKKRDLTRLIDKLVDKGLLNRCINPNNKRSIQITITEEGLTLTRKLEENLRNELTHNLTEDDSEQLSQLLDKMR
jgi:DNA-binding MarR family transcriptional regulator